MAEIAFVTCERLRNLTADDLLAAEALRKKGHAVHAAVWNEAGVRWEDYDLVLIRSPWDYYLHIREFWSWLDALHERAVNVHNPLNVLRWNSEKSYLPLLAGKGVPIVPTTLVAPDTALKLSLQFDELACGGDCLVIKPAVSAGAWKTMLVRRNDLDSAQHFLESLQTEGTVLVQPYRPEVATEGEWSFLFFGGIYSHAVLKRPAHGDFRVQEKHGGHLLVPEAPPGLQKQAEDIYEALGEKLVYARIDAVADADQRLLLMEAELLEPELFLRCHPAAPDCLAAAIEVALSGAKRE